MKGFQILLAGGSGGLGSVAARLLAGEGARLIVSYRADAERAAAVGSVATIVQADLVQSQDRAKLLDLTADLYGVAIFAGDPARISDPSQMEAVMRRSHEVNYQGPILLAREAADRMKMRGIAGAIVLVSSMQAVSIFPGSTAYAAEKAALIHAAKILAKECRGKHDIRVNVVCPGVNKAGMAEASIAAGKYNRYLEEGVISRFGRAEDVARGVRFFLEPDSYTTGQVLTIDGGLTL